MDLFLEVYIRIEDLIDISSFSFRCLRWVLFKKEEYEEIYYKKLPFLLLAKGVLST